MAKGSWFWVIFVLLALLGLLFSWPGHPYYSPWFGLGWTLIVLLLIGIIGWAVFGPPVK